MNTELELFATRIIVTLKTFCQRARLAEKQHPATRFFASRASLVLIAFELLGCPSVWAQGWQDLSSTRLQDVCPANNFGGQTYAFNYYCHNVIDAWSGGVADTSRNRLIIWGGGHADYYGNEIYSLNLAANPVTLTRLTNPSPINPAPATCPAALSDGNPNSRHTQNNMVYMPNVDRMFLFNGAGACANGSGSRDTWTLDMSTLQWQRMDPVNGFNPVNSPSYSSTWSISAYDPNTQTVFIEWTDNLFQYTYSTNTYKQLNTSGHVPFAGTGVIDPKRKLFIFMGTEYQSTTPHVMAIDISSSSNYMVQDWSSLVTGCNALASANYPGLAYDPVLDRVVGWPNAGNSVYLFNPDTKTCSVQTLANGPQNPVPANGSGTFGRFQYFPALQAYGVVSSASLDAFLLRLSASSDVTPPTVSMTAPANGANVNGAITVSASASDNIAVASVQFQLDGANMGAAVTSAPYSVSWNTATAINGSHTLTAVAVDTSGNSATATPVKVSVNNVVVPPSVSMTAPANGATVTGTITVSASASSTLGVASVQFKLDGGSLGAASVSAPYTASLDTTTASNGSHTLTAMATDAAGNSTTAPAVAIIVSNIVASPPVSPITGLGASTLTCLDRDGDQYGVGPGCLGPDADDTDATVHTAAQAIAKYGTMASFLSHLGYLPTNIWYLDVTNGQDSTGVKNDVTHPYLTYAAIATSVAPGDIVMLRQGTYTFQINPPNGTVSSPVVYMSYPGEQATFATPSSGILILDISYLTIDGLKFTNGSCMSGGTYDIYSTTQSQGMTFRHIDAGGGGGCGLGGIAAFNALVNWTIEDSVFHDNNCGGGTCQHGVYLGSRQLVSSNVTVHRNLFYGNAWSGFHFNGRVSNLVFEQNIVYNNGSTGISLQQGVNHSFIRSNLVFNNTTGFQFYNYQGACLDTTAGYSQYICPYDQNYNLIENNTFYSTGMDAFDLVTAYGQSLINVSSDTSGCIFNTTGTCGTSPAVKQGDLGHNTYRNNIFVSWGNTGSPAGPYHHPPVIFPACKAGTGQYFNQPCVFDSSETYLSTSTFVNNVFWEIGTYPDASVIGYGPEAYGYVPYNCSTASSVTSITGCIDADPMFVAASPTYWTSPSSFNFRLQSSSPAVGAGNSVGVPPYDLVGYTFANPPAIGAYQFGSRSISPCDLNGDGIVDAVDVQSAISQALGTSTCSNAALQGNGQCNIVDVQRVLVASLGGACVTGP